ncbi:haloacid dehalogenase [Histophilus somni]|uniref:phosphoglycolate phosphatase n=1 Tax=Histophilus somni TaxID=731 RepID=A0A9Q6YZH7_HISSO|nr:HAD hydrolase-like protein [Histophilus somni]ARU65623.1 haloacid dehalogenase [Histophilus somni]ARU67492.1 haloacid dehalogenase [Histophilus somni]ARU69374.1 haloacid dehalogenase [Histophilus somni]ARU71250.1 haloacid dehalogenase [Histophilus somni]ARU73121.1 haloacid dehalogenase [Histophilus somni]
MTTFIPKHKFIVCIDSDGCAMDTMNIKHDKCFGPYAVEIFGLTDEARFIEIWNRINLYSQTRGINRFKGLILSLEEYSYEQDFSQLKHWVNTTSELSNRSLIQAIQDNHTDDLKLALAWSEKVNMGIKTLHTQDKPFRLVKRSLAIIKEFADIAVVSSANNEAILDEWTRHGLLPFVDLVYGQDEGTKTHCLNQLAQYGYQPNNILMVGDSPGDLNSANEASVNFFPILCGNEDESWDQLVLETLGKLVYQKFDSQYQAQLVAKFNANLTA